jgi:hypothetical protein
MPATGRFYVCARCRVQVIVCRRCDRGQIYCDGDCALAARRNSVQEAGRRYQRSRHGRLAHAERMRRYRALRNKVTHQGSAAAAADALLLANPTTSTKATTPDTDRRLPARCHFCHRACSALVRLGPLRTRVFHHVRTATDLTGNDP